MLTPMLLVMVAIGGTDILFALDSIPAIFGLTQSGRERAVVEDSAHQTGGERKEVRAVAPLRVLHVDEAQVGLVDERRRLQYVVHPLAGHRALRESPEPGATRGPGQLERTLVPSTPGAQ